MTPRAQKNLAIMAVLTVAALFVGANAHLLIVALQSQPECRASAEMLPARRAC